MTRTHRADQNGCLSRRFPEIHDGIVQIKSIAREPGSRTKIAVHSKDPQVDPLGACVGPNGNRVNVIVDELAGEKIDIVVWSSDPNEFIAAALSPAKVASVEADVEGFTADGWLLPDYQLVSGPW